MADEKEKVIENDQETTKPAAGKAGKKDELSEKDLSKASGGSFQWGVGRG